MKTQAPEPVISYACVFTKLVLTGNAGEGEEERDFALPPIPALSDPPVDVRERGGGHDDAAQRVSLPNPAVSAGSVASHLPSVVKNDPSSEHVEVVRSLEIRLYSKANGCGVQKAQRSWMGSTLWLAERMKRRVEPPKEGIC